MEGALETASQGMVTVADVEPVPGLQVPRTMTIEERARDLTGRAGFLRNQTAIATGDVAEVHRRSLRLQLDTRIARLVTQDPAVLLTELADLGFAWREIARMVGVSVPALRRWRNGETPTGENRRAIARLLAFAQIIGSEVFKPASWMEVPVSGEAPVTSIDLYAAGRLDVVFDLATGNYPSPETALDAAEPGWRDRYRSDWAVQIAADGQPYIGPRMAR